MGTINWMEKLGWDEEHVEDLRYTGYAYIKQGKYDIARSFFEALVILDPNNGYDAQTLGAIYLEMNEPEKALKYFDTALKIEADHTPTLINLTKAFMMLGKTEDGLRLANILKNDPNPAIANVAKALLLAYS